MNKTISYQAIAFFGYKSQYGAVMIVSLVLLVVLTLLGITGSQFAGLEEKMAGNLRDYNIAFQAAEAGLRDAELEIQQSATIANYRFCVNTGFSDDCGFSTADTTDDGLCLTNRGYSPDVNTALTNGFCLIPLLPTDPNRCFAAITDPFKNPPSVVYGTFTNAPPIPNVSAQPRYLIEGFPDGTTMNGVSVRLFPKFKTPSLKI